MSPPAGVRGWPEPVLVAVQSEVPVQTTTIAIDGGIRFRGRVLRAGEPVRNATVAIVREGHTRSLLGAGPVASPELLGQTSRTDRDGAFEFSGVAPGLCELQLYTDHLFPIPRLALTVSPRMNTVEWNIETGRLSGMVTTRSGAGLPGVEVYAFTDDDLELLVPEVVRLGTLSGLGRHESQRMGSVIGKTDADGKYRLGLVAGKERARVLAFADGHIPVVSAPINLREGLEVKVEPMVLEAGCELTLETTAEWLGRTSVVIRCLESEAGAVPSIDEHEVVLYDGIPAKFRGLRPGAWSVQAYDDVDGSSVLLHSSLVELSVVESMYVQLN